MTKKVKKNIVALTTDPYENIYGYSLVFLKLVDFIRKNQTNYNVVLISNDGISSSKIECTKVVLNRREGLFIKTIKLSMEFLKLTYNYPKDTIFLANCEIPELFVAMILRIKYKKVYCIIQDARIRENNLYGRFACFTRFYLARRIKHVIFTNKYTYNTFSGNLNRYYIGNPIFT